MAFHPGDLPASVQALFNKHIHSPILWPIVVQEAVRKGIKNADTLANIVFYMHHPDLIGTPIAPGQKKLSDEWIAWRGMVKSGIGGWSKPGASSGWEPYQNSPYSGSGNLSKAVKDWLAKPPAHDREVGIFKSKRFDNGRSLAFFAWKTQDSKKNCIGHKLHDGNVLHGWFELETSLSAIKTKHKLKTDWISVLGNDAGGKGVAAMNLLVNKLMFHYVMNKGMCIWNAKDTAWREARKEAKATIELIAAVVSAGSGAKGGGGRPDVLPTRSHTSLKLSQLDWKSFVKQINDIYNGEYGKSSSVSEKAYGFKSGDKIYGEGNEIVGLVKYFD